MSFFTSEHRQLGRLQRSYRDPMVELHPDTTSDLMSARAGSRRRGVRPGDPAQQRAQLIGA
jgi:hypothetical protein